MTQEVAIITAAISASASIITGVVAYLAGMNKNKTDLKTAQEKNDSEMEKFYAGNVTFIVSEYKEQVSGFRNELENVRREFAEFKETHTKVVAEYESKITYLELQLEHRDDRIEELEAIVIEKDSIIRTLKGEI